MHQKVNRLYLSKTRFLFHCNIKIKVPVEYGEPFLDECFQIYEEVDRRYNSYCENSYFDKINRNAGNWVEVDNQVLSLISDLTTVTELTNGAYNIAVLPLLHLWGFYSGDEGSLPSNEEIKAAIESINEKQIQISGNKVRIDENQAIITGSFIKAYATDVVIQHIKNKGITDALINAGGSTIFALNDEQHPYWQINIPHPVDNTIWKELRLSNQAFSMSGRKNHFRLIDGKQYGHIINGRTGWPSTHLQTGVIANTAFWSDVLSAAFFASYNLETRLLAELFRQIFSDQFSYYCVAENWNGENIDFNPINIHVK